MTAAQSEELLGLVMDEQRIVTSRWLAVHLSVSAAAAQSMLQELTTSKSSKSLAVTYFLTGQRGTGRYGIDHSNCCSSHHYSRVVRASDSCPRSNVMLTQQLNMTVLLVDHVLSSL